LIPIINILSLINFIIKVKSFIFAVIYKKIITPLDRLIFKQFFETHYSPLCNLAYRIIGDIDKSEDIVQDVFVKVWNNRDQLDKDRNIKSLVYTMVKNHSLEVLRRDGIGLRVVRIISKTEEDSQSNIQEEEIENYKLLDQIYVSIRQLPPKCGEVFTLSKVNGLTYTQIAERMNISVKTVENHMGKALKLLREMIIPKP
jgi:RNA polymerase sigma-70 factor (ECF subfamily)